MLAQENPENRRAFMRDYLEGFRKAACKSGTWQSKFVAERLFQVDIMEQIDSSLNKAKREDRDFLSYRIHKSAHSVQQRLLLSTERLRLCMAGRRSGKTEGFVRLAADVCVRREDAKCLLIGKTDIRCKELFWQPTLDLLEMVGFVVEVKNKAEGFVRCREGVEISFKGNATADEREKLRGGKYDLVVIDECQSQKALKYLIEEIIEPMLIDRQGILALGGTGPRVRGEYWEALWSDNRPALRLNWSIKDNPYIPNYEKVLEDIRREKGLKETDSLYVREYLGQISYDDDALVCRLEPANFFTNAQLAAWIASQPVTDVRFTAGLDYGFTDADGFGIIAYSEHKPERWLVYEYKARRTGVTEVAEAIKRGIQYVRTDPLFSKLVNKDFMIYADSGGGGKKISYELANQYGLPILDAYKVNADLAVELLQAEVRTGAFRCRAGGAFEDECRKTVFARDELDQLTRIIDDEAYHPDLMKAIHYGMRPVWLFSSHGGAP